MGGLKVFFSKRTIKLCLVICGLSQIFFLINIQFPKGFSYDEFHYVPSAKQFLALQENKNFEHPPLAKLLIATSIAIGGDRPFGWRLMSTLFGSLTLVGMFLWGLALFKDEKSALLVALLTFLNQLLYVQARVAMLDTFMVGFLVYGLTFFTMAWDPTLKRKKIIQLFIASGILMGLATACKWSALVAWGGCVGIVGFVFLKNKFKRPGASSLWKNLKITDFIFCFLIVPLFFYYLTFIPFFFIHRTPPYTLWDILFQVQWNMWDGQLHVTSAHPYMSKWTSWPWMTRPIWYAFENEGTHNELARGVVFLGNPLILWSGLWALMSCFWDVVEKRSREAFIITLFYALFYFSWAIIPRKLMFYYYYYPAGMVLSLALVFLYNELKELNKKWAQRGLVAYLVLAFGLFAFFYPILAALKIPTWYFYKLMWFRSWI